MSALLSELQRVNATAIAIQGAASAMMKHYERSAKVAVNEWRNALQTVDKSQLLPLLYVCNEVVQISKRNRGNNFVVAFGDGDVLLSALAHICRKTDAQITEKVRRTVKIWGDRGVYSYNFVNRIMGELEQYREGNRDGPPKRQTHRVDEATFSPTNAPASPNQESSDDDSHSAGSLARDDNDDDNNKDTDDDDIFGEKSGSQGLDIEIDDSVLEAAQTAPTVKRRRSSLSVTGGLRRRTSASLILSAANMKEIWTQLGSLKKDYDKAAAILNKIKNHVDKNPDSAIELLVGDELQAEHQKNDTFITQMDAARKDLHRIADERHRLEMQAMMYLPWLERTMKQDAEDLAFCDALEAKLTSFQDIHKAAKEAREVIRNEKRIKAKQEVERERQRKEEEETEKFRKAALAKETEAKAGMVWNPSTREYQALNTDESWRE